MHNVQETAICYHQNGIIKEYKMIKTEDLPKSPGNTPPTNGSQPASHEKAGPERPLLFDPNLIKANALNVLGFIKSQCKREGGTYWLFKDQDKN
jgi:hypothetical protein